MLNRTASIAKSTSVLKALPGKLDIKRRLVFSIYGSIVYSYNINNQQYNFPKKHTASLTYSTPSKNELKRDFLWAWALTVLFTNLYSVRGCDKNYISNIIRQHPWPYAVGNRILIAITVSEI